MGKGSFKMFYFFNNQNKINSDFKKKSYLCYFHFRKCKLFIMHYIQLLYIIKSVAVYDMMVSSQCFGVLVFVYLVNVLTSQGKH